MIIRKHINESNTLWNPWLGCSKISEACENCYIKQFEFNNTFRTLSEDMFADNVLIAVGTHTDFFLPQADHLRNAAWSIIRNHPKTLFEIYTKRVERIESCLPPDWGEGWENVVFCITVENQKRADERIPILLNLPCKHRWLNCAPLLEKIDLTKYFESGKIESITTSGERKINGQGRITDYTWMESLSEQCKKFDIHFEIMFLGHSFKINNEIISDYSKCFQSPLAFKLGLNNYKPLIFNI